MIKRKNVDIDEKTLADALNMEETLSALEKATVEVRDKTYITFLHDFLSNLQGAHDTLTGIVDVAMMRSLKKKDGFHGAYGETS